MIEHLAWSSFNAGAGETKMGRMLLNRFHSTERTGVQIHRHKKVLEVVTESLQRRVRIGRPPAECLLYPVRDCSLVDRRTQKGFWGGVS